MPSENTPVLKRTSYEASQFWEAAADEIEVTASGHLKPSKEPYRFISPDAYDQLPFQKQLRPGTLSTSKSASKSPLKSFSNDSLRLEYNRSSRSIELEILKTELLNTEIAMHSNTIRYNTHINAALKVNKAMAHCMSVAAKM